MEGHMPVYSYTAGSYTSSYSYLFQPKTLYGSWGNDMLQGGYGNDTIIGGYGEDVLYGGYGDDWLDGGADNDMMNGAQGNDTLIGGAGHDWLLGGAGNDWLWGGTGNDHFSGDLGKDVIVLGTGSDTIYFSGGWNANQQSVATNAQADVIHDWSSDDFVAQSYSTAGKPYFEFGANVYSVDQAAALANQYYAQGAMSADTGQVFVYNSLTDTGYLLLDLDNDAGNTFETGAILVGAGQAWDMSGANFL
jgi:Ca2+-binding RTX toxin-like protein